MTARASASNSMTLTIERSPSTSGASSPKAGTGSAVVIASTLTDEVEVGEAREHRLAPHRWVLEGHRDLLVAAGQLRCHDDAVTPSTMPDAIAIAELALAGDDRARRADGSAGSGST